MTEAILPSLEAFEPISLSEMDQVGLMNRIDTKYVASRSELPHLLGAAAPDYRILTVDGVRLAPYETLYFDTPDCACFLQHHNGKLNRYKYRIREYSTSGACFLEIKCKNNKGRTDKRRLSIPRIEETISGESLAFLESIVGRDHELTPQLWTYFSRITLVHRRVLERVTFDFDLSFRSEQRRQDLRGVAVIEIKQEFDDRQSTMRELLRKQQIRPLRVSKYCLGSLLLKPQLKGNRFKEKLLAIQRIS